MELDTDAVVQRESHTAWRMFGPDGVVMNLESGGMSGLNEAAALIWEWLETPQTVGDLATALTVEYDDVTLEQAQRDVIELLGQLAERNLVRWSST